MGSKGASGTKGASGIVPASREGWALLASGAVLLGAAWLREPSATLAALFAFVTLVLIGLSLRARREAALRRTAFLVAAISFVALTGRYHLTVGRLERAGSTVIADRARAGAAAIAADFGTLGDDLARSARSALEVSGDRETAFTQMESLLDRRDDRALVMAERGTPFAWAGRLLVPVDSLPGPLGVIATPFYVVAYATARSATRVAVATVLVHAEPPADRLSEPLDRRVAERYGLRGFAYAGAGAAADVPDAVVLRLGGEPMLAARALVASPETLEREAAEWVLPRAGLALAVLVLLLLATAWQRDGGLGWRLAGLGVAFGVVAIVPLSAFSNQSVLFDPAVFFVASGWRFTANAGALAITSALLLLALLSALRERVRPRSRTQALVGVLLVAGVGPFLLRELARGIQVPSLGVPTGLWLSWQVTLFLASVTVLLLGVAFGQAALGTQRGLSPWVAPAFAALAAVTTPLVLEAPARLPPLHPLLWVAAIGALAFTRRARAMVLPVAFVAACGAVTLVWFSTVRERVELAVEDVAALRTPDPNAAPLLRRFASRLDPASADRTRVDVLVRYAESDLAGTDFPTEIATWAPDGSEMAELRVGRGPGETYGVNLMAREAQASGKPSLRESMGEPGTYVVLAVPHRDGSATTVVLAPRSRLVAPDPFGALLGLPPPPTPEPPYNLRQGDLSSGPPTIGRHGSWSRSGAELHGDWQVASTGGLWRRVHATIDLRSFDALVTRGVLLVLSDLAMLGAVWLLIVTADGVLRRWWRMRRRDLVRSFRARLSLALFACFLLPSVLFALWSFQRLQADDRQSRDLLVRETLRAVAATDSVQLAATSLRFETPLFLYANGLLYATSDPLLDAIAPVGRLLPPGVARTLAEGDEPTAGRGESVGPAAVRLGYRAVMDAGTQFVLAAPARLDERLLDRRRNDLAIFLLFALALGGIAALWASGTASRQLSRPINELRGSALSLARGEQPATFTADPPVEFVPVFAAFQRMTTDLAESRAALETAERRLAATLRNVASGVVAVDDVGRITFANPRAERILGAPLAAGVPLGEAVGAVLAERIEAFRAGEEDDAFELEREGRRLQVRVARLAPNVRRVVVTIDDVTDVARAERVLAWGEMARQVAHEIKNPLTPMRLGMQHLLRARRDGRVDFDAALEENTARVLSEIDRLDEIARAFSRYGTAPVADVPAAPVDVARVARDVLDLERLGAEGPAWEARIPPEPVLAAASERELRDVLLNLLENARLANARRITLGVQATAEGGAEVRVTDDGDGIAPELLERVFEPHFSTRTSGSGLGLAVSRRLIDGWGGSIRAERGDARGATLVVRLAPPPSA
jgi:signal transduction histidine kinase